MSSDVAKGEGSFEVVAAVSALCEQARQATAGTPAEREAQRIAARLQGPIRVAIAGRVKAGKSTLLNALVGERLAATDAGECTRLVTTYRYAPGYEVTAELLDGSTTELRFTRNDGALQIELGGLTQAQIARLDVGWPARVLSDMTLIDTPGLESMVDENSARTRAFLDHSGTNPAGADAVVYLMRHLHRSDAEFLGAFMDRTVVGASPVNALAVLSRADEIGACRPDALESAARIATRYATDPAVRTLVSAVLPVAGLLAETGLTLTEAEFAAIRELAALPTAQRTALTRSVDDVYEPASAPLDPAVREALLIRFGLYGLRRAISAVADGEVTSSTELSRRMVWDSGLAALSATIREQFLPRARLLQARSALVALRGLAATIHDPAQSASVAAQLDRIDAGAMEFSVLHAAHLVMSGAVNVGEQGAREVRAVLDADLDHAFGLAEGTPDERRATAMAGLSRWRERASDPIANSLARAVADTMVRLYERALAGMGASR